MDEVNLMPLKDARAYLGISKTMMARLVKERRFTLYLNPLDRRQKLVDLRELEAYARPRPLNQTDEPAADGSDGRAGLA